MQNLNSAAKAVVLGPEDLIFITTDKNLYAYKTSNPSKTQ
jgi:hypothetical protein